MTEVLGIDSVESWNEFLSGQVLLSFGILLGIVVTVCSGALIAVLTANVDGDDAAAYSALILVILACTISINDIRLHMKHYNSPMVQKHVCRMLLMVPIYSIQSWLSLRFYEVSLLFETLRDLYEAFVIASFIYYLIALMGGWDKVVNVLLSKPMSMGLHPKWLVCGRDIEWATMGEPLLLKIEQSALQYVVIKVLTTIITISAEAGGIYNEGDWAFDSVYGYVAIVVNFSQFYALYGLGFMYVVTFQELTRPKNWKPLGKFACIKGIVFWTWWQGFFISILQSLGAFTVSLSFKLALRIAITQLFIGHRFLNTRLRMYLTLGQISMSHMVFKTI